MCDVMAINFKLIIAICAITLSVYLLHDVHSVYCTVLMVIYHLYNHKTAHKKLNVTSPVIEYTGRDKRYTAQQRDGGFNTIFPCKS